MGIEHLKSLSRNDACWCDSGKKYKKCHLEADESAARAAARTAAQEVETSATGMSLAPAEPFQITSAHWILLGLTLAAGVGVTLLRSFGDGLIGGLAVFLVGIGYLILRDPPPPREADYNPAGLSFGTPSEAPPVQTEPTRPRNSGNPNPRARRRR